MKLNNNKLNANEKFTEDIRLIMEKYYKQAISEAVKRGLENKKKLSTKSKIAM